MALEIEKVIDLTAYEHNPDPKVVQQLSIIHEAADGELVQYYIDQENETEGDKATFAIGVYNKDAQNYTYHGYDEVTWGEEDQRICGNRIERLGVKAFPDVGAIAFYKLKHRNITRIVAPVNRKGQKSKAPTLEATLQSEGRLHCVITPPDNPTYACYRIVMQSEIYMEDCITYDLEVTLDKPRISGEYKVFAIGYGKEGQLLSRDSNVLTFNLQGESDVFVPPYYTKAYLEQCIREMKQNVYTRKILWEGSLEVADTLMDIALEDNLSKFDNIGVYAAYGDENRSGYGELPISLLREDPNQVVSFTIIGDYAPALQYESETELKVGASDSEAKITIKKIYGIKL